MVTSAQIKKICPSAKASFVSAVVDNWNVAEAAGVTTPLRVVHLLTQIATETGGLTIVEENMNYTSAKRLMQVWPTRFKTVADATPFIKNAQALAIKVYGGRMGNAPAPSTDGWDYRGGGMMQTTGREGYRKVGFESNPDALRDPATAFKTAVKEWVSNGCNSLADKDDVTAIRKKINGGTNGLDEAKAYIVKAKAVFTATTTRVTSVAAQPVKVDTPAANVAPTNDKLIAQVQDLLWDKGYPEVGESDNKFGPRTRNTILAFQADNGLPLTGAVTDDLLAQLVKAPKREMPASRADTSAKDLKSEPIVQVGSLLKNGGIATALVSTTLGGVDSIDGLNDRLSSAQKLYSTITTFAPWAIYAVVGVAVAYGGSLVIKHFVQAYREGRAL